MYSKAVELVALALITVGVSDGTRTWVGLIVGGVFLLMIGATTDDAAVTLGIKRGWGWTRYHWHRMILREQLDAERNGMLPPSPHPPLHVDPEAEEWARQVASNRLTKMQARNSPRRQADENLERLA